MLAWENETLDHASSKSLLARQALGQYARTACHEVCLPSHAVGVDHGTALRVTPSASVEPFDRRNDRPQKVANTKRVAPSLARFGLHCLVRLHYLQSSAPGGQETAGSLRNRNSSTPCGGTTRGQRLVIFRGLLKSFVT